MVYLALLLATFGIGTLTARVAGDRGRVPWRWAILSILGAVAGGISWVFFLPRSGADGGALILPTLLLLVGPLAGALMVLLVVWILPETVPPLSGARWPMVRLSTKDVPAAECVVSVDGGVLCVGDVRIAADALSELAVDGECLRIVAAGRTLTLMPTGAQRRARENTKQCQALERRIRRLLAPAR